MSKKRDSQLREYSKLRKEFFLKDENKFCKARLPGCQIYATDFHHLNGREQEQLLNMNGVAVCRSCHSYIHDKLSLEEKKYLNL